MVFRKKKRQHGYRGDLGWRVGETADLATARRAAPCGGGGGAGGAGRLGFGRRRLGWLRPRVPRLIKPAGPESRADTARLGRCAFFNINTQKKRKKMKRYTKRTPKIPK